MTPASPDSEELKRIYRSRFHGMADYRRKVWRIIIDEVFSRWLDCADTVLDLGTGQGEFINQVQARRRFAMDLNPDSRALVDSGVIFLEQDCCAPWGVAAESLDIVFTSNFFEHLPDKKSLRQTIEQAYLALRPGGRLIAMGPNIRLVPGAYWDFWDHYLPLTERSLVELAEVTGFEVEYVNPATLPYSMSQGTTPPLWLVQIYCRFPPVWRLVGKQFIVVLRKPR